MKFKMGIKNYKSFKKKQNINFAPITIFVGPNSGGKSSILKLIALMSQNYNANKYQFQYKGSIVDLKDFVSNTNNFSGEPIDIEILTFRSHYLEHYGWGLKNTIDKISYKITKDKLFVNYKTYRSQSDEIREYVKQNKYIFTKNETTNIKKVVDNHQKRFIEILLKLTNWSENDAKRKFNNFVDLTLKNLCYKTWGMKMNLYGLLPEYDYQAIPDDKLYNKYIKDWGKWYSIIDSSNIGKYLNHNFKYSGHNSRPVKFNFGDWSLIEPWHSPLYNSSLYDSPEKKITKNTQEKIEIKDLFDEDSDIFENIENNLDKKYFDLFLNIMWQYLYEVIHKIMVDEEVKIIQKIRTILQLTLDKRFANISFLPPIRKSPKKFYTSKQLLSTLYGNLNGMNEIHGQDYNVGSLIQNVTAVNNLLLKLNLKSEISIKHPTDERLNDLFLFEIFNKKSKTVHTLQDVGFGYSQILPILFSLVQATNCGFINLVIEQPELHLHPKLQSGLSNIIADAISSKRSHWDCPLFVIETHSEHIIRGIQVQIAEGVLSQNDVAVNYVGKYNNGNSFVKRMELTKKGLFKADWPGELFEDSYNQSMELLKHQ